MALSQAHRQLGSAFKPVVYAAAFEARLATPATLLDALGALEVSLREVGQVYSTLATLGLRLPSHALAVVRNRADEVVSGEDLPPRPQAHRGCGINAAGGGFGLRAYSSLGGDPASIDRTAHPRFRRRPTPQNLLKRKGLGLCFPGDPVFLDSFQTRQLPGNRGPCAQRLLLRRLIDVIRWTASPKNSPRRYFEDRAAGGSSRRASASVHQPPHGIARRVRIAKVWESVSFSTFYNPSHHQTEGR
jgi:hypothetical protein